MDLRSAGRTLFVALNVIAAPWAAAQNVAQPGPSTDGFYTPEQAVSGASIYQKQCSVCHGSGLGGGGGPALVGTSFWKEWGGREIQKIWYFVHSRMPLTAPGELSAQDSAEILAFILERNGVPYGAKPLNDTADLGRALPTRQPGTVLPLSDLAARVKANVKQPSSGRPTQDELNNADTDPKNWIAYNKGYRGYRFSTLDKINTTNASRLKAVCVSTLGTIGTFQAGPVVYGGTLFVTTKLNTFAIDATSCNIKWQHIYTPLGPQTAQNNKGVAIGLGRVIRGTTDAHLIALDIETGEQLWDVTIGNSANAESVQLAPIIWNDLVFSAKGGGDWGIFGEVVAVRASDGEKVWGFDTIPTGSDPGASSWQIPATAKIGGGALWTSMSLDPETGTLLLPVGNPAPDLRNMDRPGENLHTDSVVALDARTGKLKWATQLLANDNHDWDTTGAVLVPLKGGKTIVSVNSKNGFVYALDPDTGKILWKTPVTTLKNITLPVTPEGVHVCPGIFGGVEWNGTAYSRTNDALVVNSVDWCVTNRLGPKVEHTPGALYFGGIPIPDPIGQSKGWTHALDANTGTILWKTAQPTPMIGAVTPTAGGVVFTGDLLGNFQVLDAKSGKKIYQFQTGGPIAGGVVTYAVNGKQYVAVAAGNVSLIPGNRPGNPSIVVFGL
jgi:PQQ-dependent dehydrogenase (methanol/ethanol family)